MQCYCAVTYYKNRQSQENAKAEAWINAVKRWSLSKRDQFSDETCGAYKSKNQTEKENKTGNDNPRFDEQTNNTEE